MPERAVRWGRRLGRVEDRARRPPSPRHALLLLALSIGVEVASALAVARLPGTVLAALSFGSLSPVLLAVAARTIPAPVAAGLWAGGSAAGVAVAGLVLDRRTPDIPTSWGLALLVLGSVLLHAGGPARGRRPRR